MHLPAKDEELDQLKAEVLRLKEFENQQVEFQRIQKEFYDEVVYSDKGPGAEEYKKYYESMDPATAEYIYKQVVTQLQESQESAGLCGSLFCHEAEAGSGYF